MKLFKTLSSEPIPKKRARRALLITLSAIGAVGLLYTASLQLTGRLLPCFFHELTGLLCPGCGTTHMFLALARGELGVAFFANPLMLILLGLWLLIAALIALGRPSFIRAPRFLFGALWTCVLAMAVFMVLRNFT